jgi:dienelactone hydrolase
VKQPYLDGLGRLPESVGFLPRFFFRQYPQIDTFAIRSSPVSPAHARWPVVIFLPGFGAPRAFYTSLVTHVASHGWVVLAVDHPYEAPVFELADGSLSVPSEISQDSEAGRRAFMATRSAAPRRR